MAQRKILMVAMSLGLGGAETHIVELAKALHHKGLDISVCSNGGVYVAELAQAHIPHFQAPLHHRSLFSLFRSFLSLAGVIRQVRPDVVHAHARMPALLCHWLCKLYRIPLVTTVHFNFKVNGLLRRLTHWGQKTIAVSNDLKTYILENYRVKEENILVSVNGINAEKFSPHNLPGDICEEFALPADGLFVLSVSRLDDNACRAAELLVEGALDPCRENPRLCVVVVGAGNRFREISQKAQEINRSLGRRAIVMTGGRTDISRFTALADVFVGVSRSALEAMACEKPTVLAGNQGWLGLYSKDKLSLCVATNFTCRGYPYPSDTAVWDTVTELLEAEPELLRTIGRQSRETILQYYSVERMADDATAAYQSLLENRRAKTYDFAVTGYYGHSNAGDEALLRAVITNLHRACPDASLCALTSGSAHSFEGCQVAVAKRFNLFDILRVLARTKVFIFGGGNLIQDVTSTKSLIYYLWLLRLSHLMGKKTMLYANGIGPVLRPNNAKRTAKVLDRCSVITLRDADSLALLERLNVKKPVIAVTADETLTLSLPCEEHVSETLRRFGLQAKSYLLVSVRAFIHTPKDFLADFACAVNEAARQGGLSVAVLPMHAGVDLSESRAFAALLDCEAKIIEEELSLEEVMGVLIGARAVAAMRLHTLVFSACCATPFAGVAYDPKVESFMQTFPGLPCQPMNGFDKTAFSQALARLIAHREHYASDVKDTTDLLREKARDNAQYAKELLEGCK